MMEFYTPLAAYLAQQPGLALVELYQGQLEHPEQFDAWPTPAAFITWTKAVHLPSRGARHQLRLQFTLTLVTQQLAPASWLAPLAAPGIIASLPEQLNAALEGWQVPLTTIAGPTNLTCTPLQRVSANYPHPQDSYQVTQFTYLTLITYFLS